MAWEYKIVGLSTASAEAHLNRLGVDGWELVAFEHGQAYLKRPILTVEAKPAVQHTKKNK